MMPLRLLRALLVAAAGAEGEFVAGDLEEEFLMVCERRGRLAGHRWYAWQAIRSMAPLTAMRARSGELTAVVLRAALGIMLPLLLLDRLWSFVYSQIPLKAGAERAAEYLTLNLVILTIGTALSRTRPLSAAASAFIVTLAAKGAAPAFYVTALLLAALGSSWLVQSWRKAK